MNLKTLSIYQDAEIWLISPQGEILLSTSDDFSEDETRTIEHFNPGHSSAPTTRSAVFTTSLQRII